MTPQPGARKRATQEPPATAAMLRFVLGEDAKAGQIVDLDLNTGRLLPAAMGDLGGADDATARVCIPTLPPPGLYLRALVANWRDLVAQPAPDTDAAAAARGALSSVADQLERTLDLMGVATADLDVPSPLRYHVPYAHRATPDAVFCTRCGQPVELFGGRRPVWVTEGGEAECAMVADGVGGMFAELDRRYVPREVLAGLVATFRGEADRLGRPPAGATPATKEEAAAAALGHAAHMLAEAMGQR